MKYLVLVFIFLISFGVQAQNNHPTGARQSGMGGTGIVLSDVWATYHNQAGLAEISGLSLGVYFSNRFRMKELGLKSVAVAKPVSKYGTFALSYSYFGFELFNESKFGLAYAMKLSEKFSVGIQINYLLTQQGLDYGKSGNVAGEIGILSEPVENLYIAAHVFNPWRAKYTDYLNRTIPTIFRMGIAYNFSDKVLLIVESEKDIDYKAVFRAGLEYNIMGDFILRSGISTNPVEYSFGIGYKYRGITPDFAFVNHQILGYYFQFALNFEIPKK